MLSTKRIRIVLDRVEENGEKKAAARSVEAESSGAEKWKEWLARYT